MPTIQEKIEASEAAEAALLARMLELPGADVTDKNGENLLNALHRQRETTWQLGAWLPRPEFAAGRLGCAQQATQGQPDTFAAGPAPEPEPPTLVATEPPLPVLTGDGLELPRATTEPA